MLSSISAVRPVSVNNYSGRNSIKSQPSFGCVTSEVASEVTQKGAGFFRKVGRFLSNSRYNFITNGTLAGVYIGLQHMAPASSLKQQLLLGAACKLAAEFSDLKLYADYGILKEFSAANNPLDFSAYFADGIRAIVKSVKE